MNLLPIRFPNELLTMVIAQLSPHNLVPVSLVCRRWQRLAFPFLYHSMYLSKCTHLEALGNRLLEDNVPDSLSVPAHLKCLAFGGSDINYINPEYFELILPRLVHLTSLSWELPYTPRHFGPFVDCPKLKAVHLEPLHMWGDDEWIERLPQLLIFTNLTHFSLKFEPIPYEREDEVYEAVSSLIQRCPGLESIILSFQDRDYIMGTYSPDCIFELLGEHFVLPRLHTLHMLGAADPDWLGFVLDPTNPFRAFLARHPFISDLAIGCPITSRPGSLRMDPDDLSRLLPSVTHLALPSFMWESVVQSKLAPRLESLSISNPAFVFEVDPLGSIAELMGEGSFPNVRKIAILAQIGHVPLKVGALDGFLSAAKGLEELEFELHIERAACYERRKTQYRVIEGKWDLPPGTAEYEESEYEESENEASENEVTEGEGRQLEE